MAGSGGHFKDIFGPAKICKSTFNPDKKTGIVIAKFMLTGTMINDEYLDLEYDLEYDLE